LAKGLPLRVKENLEKCRTAAIAAVETYNRPGPRFRTAQYLILIIIAWTAIFHAIYYQKRKRPWYRQKSSGSGKGIRYIKVDGEPKHWDLSECLKQHYGDKNPPERKNLEFLIGLRNKIEHRHLPELDTSLFGECQAALLNLETILVSEFGHKYALMDQLAVSLQFSQLIPDEKAKATKRLVISASKNVVDYVEKFRSGLPSGVLNSMKYSFSVYLVPRVANRAKAADAAVQFVRVDEASEEELKRLEKLNVLIKEKHIPIANLGLYKPGEVVSELEKRLSLHINMADHTDAWRYFGVRPPQRDPHPDRTRSEYCFYDDVHEDYVYTNAWVEMLVKEFSDAARFEEITGHAPRTKASNLTTG
jgi:hypothetical protein